MLQDEQNAGLAMMQALDEAQRKKAILEVSKTGNNNLTEAFKDNVVLDYAGLRADALSAEAQRKQLLDLVALYVGNMDDGHARVKMDEVRQHLDQTWFAWIGDTDDRQRLLLPHPQPGDPDRVRSPGSRPTCGSSRTIRTRPNPQHIHIVVRTPNGNDYGKDLLRQHYLQHPHATPDSRSSSSASR